MREGKQKKKNPERVRSSWNFGVLPNRFSASNVINTQFFSKIRAKIL